MRECKTCKTEKPLTVDFWPIRWLPSGQQTFRHTCKQCTNDQLREKARLRMARLRAKDGNASGRKAVKKWKRAHPLENTGQQHGSVHSRIARAQRPMWPGRKAMAEIYKAARQLRNSGVAMQIDHVIPLKSEFVCGLHVLNNLQFLSVEENNAKGNFFDPALHEEPIWPVGWAG